MSAIPQRYLEIITPLIAQARAFLEKGEPLAPIAFVGNFTTGAIAPVAIATDTIDAKDRIADSIRLLAGQMDADFVFLLMEAYSLRPDKVPRYEEILDEYGSLANCSANWRMDVVSLTLETSITRTGPPHGPGDLIPACGPCPSANLLKKSVSCRLSSCSRRPASSHLPPVEVCDESPRGLSDDRAQEERGAASLCRR